VKFQVLSKGKCVYKAFSAVVSCGGMTATRVVFDWLAMLRVSLVVQGSSSSLVESSSQELPSSNVPGIVESVSTSYLTGIKVPPL
jgi:hypothetical protein